MKRLAWGIFGAHGQVALGVLCFLAGAAWWVYIEYAYRGDIVDEPLVAAIFRVSMFFGLVACYAIVATGLGYRATERVETAVVDQAEEVEQAEQVEQAEHVERADRVG